MQTKRPGPAPREHVLLNITKRCNQHCPFCFEGDRLTWDEPDLERVKELLDQTRAKSDEAILMGGEALLRPDILEVLEYAHSIGLSLSVFSNGTPFAKPGFVDALGAAGLRSVVMSCHFPDAEAFAKGTGTRPERYEQYLGGLRALAEYNRNCGAEAHRRISVECEVLLLSLNHGRLGQIHQTLQANLGETYRSLALKGASPFEPEKGMRIPADLLVPFAQEREALLAFLASWDGVRELKVLEVPLCLLPGFERYAWSARAAANDVDVANNFADKRVIAPGVTLIRKHQSNPYRFVCRGCDLASVCTPTRTSWRAGNFLPDESQAPSMVTGDRALQALALFAKGASVEASQLQARSHGLSTLVWPEVVFLDALRRPGSQFTVRSVWAERRPLFGLKVEGFGRQFRVHVGFPQGNETGGYLMGPYRVDVEGAESAGGDLLKALLGWLASAATAGAASWAEGATHIPRDAQWLSSGNMLWLVLGKDAWPGVGTLAGWNILECRTGEAGQVFLRVEQPLASVSTRILWSASSQEGSVVEGPGGFTPIYMGASFSLFLEVVADYGGGILERHLALEELARELAERARRFEGDSSAGPGGAAGGSGKGAGTIRAGSPSELVILFQDKMGKLPDHVFRLDKQSVDRPAFKTVSTVSIRYDEVPILRAFEVLSAFVVEAVRRKPFDTENEGQRGAFASYFTALVQASQLSERFDCRVLLYGAQKDSGRA